MRYISTIGVLTIGVVLGFSSTYLFNTNPMSSDKDQDEIRLGSSFKFVNPLLDCNQGPNFLSKNSIKPFKPVIQEVVDNIVAEKRADYVSVYFRDLNNGTWFGINESEKFFPASLMKTPLLIYYLKSAENNPKILEDEVQYVSGQEDASQFFKVENPVEIGKTYKIGDLLEHTIIESDNNAALLLLKIAKKDEFEKIFFDLGVGLPSQNGQDYISVKSYSAFFRVLFNASYLSTKYSESALDLLSQVKFKSGLVAKLPSSITVSHKFGETENNLTGKKQLHDCGIVYYPNKPYLICIMTRGDNFNSLASAIADISDITYKEIKSQVGQ